MQCPRALVAFNYDAVATGQELIVPVPLNFSATEVTAAICRRVREKNEKRLEKLEMEPYGTCIFVRNC